ncbi:tetratricopeptide repeat protein [Microcella flavibacter]|uniref:tetratricopeptide repeat protein n=1 Tax=Microcella flavibacter TaxID=1804990 RepID=UPI001456E14D|nr:tetratricopeptide repeat protein [Microcella flavibacter]
MTDAPFSPAAMRGAVDLTSLVRAASAPPASAAPAASGASGAPAAPGAAPAGGLVRDVDDVSFGEMLELSSQVPVIVEFYAQGIAPALGAIIASYDGRLALATVDGNRAPQLAQAFQVQQVPAVAAVIGGRPMQLFVGMPAEAELRSVLEEVLQVAAQNGVTGVLDVAEEAEAPAEEPLAPLHQAAYDAISSGDYAAAVEAYRQQLAQAPRDQEAVAGLAQASLLLRLDGTTAAALRDAAAAGPHDADAQLAVADLDLSGGHVEDAYGRLLDVFPALDAEGRTAVRTRLLEYFEIVGAEDPRTVAARRRLTALLY